jgi:ribosomal protein L11 methyltransferase
MDYIELNCLFDRKDIDPDILVAVLSSLGYESFMDSDTGIIAYIPSSNFNLQLIKETNIIKDKQGEIDFKHSLISERNWNTEWESAYEPVIFPGKCAIIAPFHEPCKDVPLNIIIEPKMSFGTAHHATTAMMIEMIHDFSPEGKSVADIGCGTGILAILSLKLGASRITAIDNDKWAYQNTLENFRKNNLPPSNVYQGEAEYIAGKKFDIILANINRNILISEIPIYRKSLVSDGLLILSGFYIDDIPDILEVCKQNNLRLVKKREHENWVALAVKLQNVMIST